MRRTVAVMFGGRSLEHDVSVVSGLQILHALDPQLGQIVELRFFGGLDNPSVAESLGISLRSVERGWRTARAFLIRDLEANRRGEP